MYVLCSAVVHTSQITSKVGLPKSIRMKRGKDILAKMEDIFFFGAWNSSGQLGGILSRWCWWCVWWKIQPKLPVKVVDSLTPVYSPGDSLHKIFLWISLDASTLLAQLLMIFPLISKQNGWKWWTCSLYAFPLKSKDLSYPKKKLIPFFFQKEIWIKFY